MDLSCGRYRIEGRLGAGSFGVVFRATDLRRDQPVALKTLRRLSPAALHGFKNEFRALAGIAHPNLVTLYELAVDGEQWYFTMELVEGVDFLRHVRGAHLELSTASGRPGEAAPRTLVDPPAASFSAPQRTLPLDEEEPPELDPSLEPPARTADLARLRPALRQLAEGVHALHTAGKLHRDIKPSNVLCTAEGRVVLLDFGLVLGTDEPLLDPEVIVGTPSYMSPEQARGDPISEASDWYAVGAILYEALTGRRPYRGDQRAVIAKKQTQDPPPPWSLIDAAPEDLSLLCMQLLARDPGCRPTGEALLQALGSTRRERARRRTSPGIVREAPFVGRVRELEALEDAFRASRRGGCVVVHVHGVSGIGKSALCRELLSQLGSRGQALTLAGRCFEREAVPFGAVDSLMDRLCDHLRNLDRGELAALLPPEIRSLARLFPTLERLLDRHSPSAAIRVLPDRLELRRLAFAALRSLFQRLAARQPLVVFVDDLQWGDEDSALLLTELLRPPDAPPLLLLVSSRTGERERGGALGKLLEGSALPGGPEIREVEVEGLRVEEAQVLASVLSGLTGARAQISEIVRESRGSPYFLQELIIHLGDASPDSSGELSLSLAQVLRGRIQQLPADARGLLEVVSLGGQPTDQEVACRAASVKGTGLAALTLLSSAKLVRITADRMVEPYHDQIRELVVRDLTPELRREHHLRLALALEESHHPDPDLLALHWQGAGETERAAKHAERAAERAFEALAFEHAARLYRLALQLRATQGPLHMLRVRLGDALSHAGQSAEAARAYLAAVEGAGHSEATALRRRAIEELTISGRIDEAKAILEVLLCEAGLRIPRSRRGADLHYLRGRLQLALRGLCFRVRPESEIAIEELNRIDTCMHAGYVLGIDWPSLGAALHTQHLLRALRAGEPRRLTLALARELTVVATRGKAAPDRRLLGSLRELSESVGDPVLRGHVELALGGAEISRGGWRRARQLCDHAAEIYRTHCTRTTWHLDTAQVLAISSLMMLGEIRELSQRYPRMLKEADEQNRFYLTSGLRIWSYLLWLAADRPEEGRSMVQSAARRDLQSRYLTREMLDLIAEVSFDLYLGDGASAWARVRDAATTLANPLLRYAQAARILVEWHSTLAALGAAVQHRAGRCEREALESAGRLARRIAGERTAWGNAIAESLLGSIAAARGEREHAAHRLERAEGLCSAADMNLIAAACRRRRGLLVEGETGRALTESADTAMRAEGIVNPARFAAVYAPGPG
jgi:tetratricopeptide (TPR) repeat protein